MHPLCSTSEAPSHSTGSFFQLHSFLVCYLLDPPLREQLPFLRCCQSIVTPLRPRAVLSRELLAASRSGREFHARDPVTQDGSHLDHIQEAGVLRVCGRIQNAQFCYSVRHPAVLHGKHQVTKLIIYSEHLRLLHAGPTLVAASLSRRYHIIGSRKAVYSVTCGCITCRRTSAMPQPQMLGQLPPERLMPGSVFENVGVDYAGPVYIKYGFVCKPTTVRHTFVSSWLLSVKAVHLELVSDLTTEAFIATLR